jgi:hypothetical protein
VHPSCPAYWRQTPGREFEGRTMRLPPRLPLCRCGEEDPENRWLWSVDLRSCCVLPLLRCSMPGRLGWSGWPVECPRKMKRRDTKCCSQQQCKPIEWITSPGSSDGWHGQKYTSVRRLGNFSRLDLFMGRLFLRRLLICPAGLFRGADQEFPLGHRWQFSRIVGSARKRQTG